MGSHMGTDKKKNITKQNIEFVEDAEFEEWITRNILSATPCFSRNWRSSYYRSTRCSVNINKTSTWQPPYSSRCRAWSFQTHLSTTAHLLNCCHLWLFWVHQSAINISALDIFPPRETSSLHAQDHPDKPETRTDAGDPTATWSKMDLWGLSVLVRCFKTPSGFIRIITFLYLSFL